MNDDNDAERGWILPAHQSRSRAQRDRLLRAGEKIFAKRGFGDSHVSEIVREANCSIGSFYRRFKDKEALFFALQADMYEQARVHIGRFFANPLSEQRSLTFIFFRLVENSGNEARRIVGYYRALFEMSLRGHNVWDQMRALEKFEAECLQQLLSKRGHKKFPADFVDVMSFLIRTVHGSQISLLIHGTGPYQHNDFESTKALARIMMREAGVEPDDREFEAIRAARVTGPAKTVPLRSGPRRLPGSKSSRSA